MSKTRWRNIAKTLANNSRNAMLIAIEIHNKPICPYRLQTVVILIVHSWELLAKAYTYKYIWDKQILEVDEESRYTQFYTIIHRIHHTNPQKFRYLRDNLLSINNWRNIIIHWSPPEECDELIFQFITKSILLYKDFITEFFPKENLDILKDASLLPILFNLPFTTTDLLTNKSITKNASKEVLEFLQDIQEKTKQLAADGFDEMIFIGIRTEFTSDNKNADLISKIENNNPDSISFKKDSVFRISDEKSAQHIRVTFTKEEKNEKFPIIWGNNLQSQFKKLLDLPGSFKVWIYNDCMRIQKRMDENIKWIVDSQSWSAHRYSNAFLDDLFNNYKKKMSEVI